MPVRNAVGRTTRDYLRAETAQWHDRLDQQLAVLLTGDALDYRRFLEIQYWARRGVEKRLATTGGVNLPPTQTDLIAQDLVSLGRAVPADAPDFALPADCDLLGVCWVLAGSSLGNRVILARLAKHDARLPTAFLSDESMGTYWRQLRPMLESSHVAERDHPVLTAARATFAHFNAVPANSTACESA